jgi:glycosyltransferase involved in cell wall biosynthesis
VTYTLDSLTITVKTFKRPKTLLTLLQSIRSFYPDIPILVADDSEPHEIVSTQKALRKFKKVDYFELPFDSGLSAGRNHLISQVSTPLVMVLDDDTVFGEMTRVEYALDVLNRFSSINLVAGWYEPEIFYGSLVVEDGRLIRDLHICRKIVDTCPLFDFVANMFIAKTESVASVLWDPELKIQEHMDFFWRARGNMNVTYLPYFRAQNTHAREDTDYESFRGRFEHFQQLQSRKIGVSEIISRENDPTYLRRSIDRIFIRPGRR